MRIIAGRFRGRRLTAVGRGDAASQLRPTADRVRESLFSGLAHRGVLEAAVVLDLFAGTGALGFEALSRGAARVTFVENGRIGAKLISENISLLDVASEVRLLRRDATRMGPADDAPANLVFLDPPYGKDLGQKALAAAAAGGWIGPRALVVWEEQAPMAAPDGFDPLDTRRFGDTYVTLLAYGR